MATNAGPNKRMGDAGRLRNTVTNRASKGPAIPGVPQNVGTPSVPGFGASFDAAAGATGQLASAYAGFQAMAAAMRAKRVGLRAQFKTDRAGIKAAGIGAMSDVINTGIDRGLTGASSVSQERIGVIADTKAQVKSAKAATQLAITDTKVAEQQAYLDYQIAQQQIAAQAAAARQANDIANAQLAAQEAAGSALMDSLEALAGQGQTVQTATKVAGSMVIPGVINPATGKPSTYIAATGEYLPGNVKVSELRSRILAQRNRETFLTGRIESGRM